MVENNAEKLESKRPNIELEEGVTALECFKKDFDLESARGVVQALLRSGFLSEEVVQALSLLELAAETRGIHAAMEFALNRPGHFLGGSVEQLVRTYIAQAD